jgi:beta-lactam-binding protein with PASTA domain
VAKAAPDTTIPNVVGQPIDAARKLLVDAGFEVPEPALESSPQPKGTVLKQAPAAGEPAKGKSMVRLVIAEPPPIVVPKVTAGSLTRARKLLTDAGLTVGTVRRVEDEERGENYVLRQDPSPDTEVPPGTAVDLTVVAPD